jgi:hypothetical protein
MADRARSRALQRAILVGTVLQLVMVLSGHWVAAVAALFAVVGMAISLLAGWLASFWGSSRGGRAALDGALAGGVCALIGIVVSYLLGDVPIGVIAFGTVSSAVTGALGGWLGGMRSVEN